jgi:hypothetical protein
VDVNRRPPDDAWLQERYARWLDGWTRVAYVVCLLAFIAYVFGVLPPLVPPEQLPRLWHLPLAQYLEATGAPTGWAWLHELGRGDYANFFGLALFACIVLVCHAAMIGPLLRRGERLLAALAAAQVAVLLFAASGLFAGG